jgi:type III secretion system HrpE/YscL family protein
MNELPNAHHIIADLPFSPWIVRGRLVEAQKQADEVLLTAKAHADRIRAEAAAQADDLLKQAWQEGLREGAVTAASLIAEVAAGVEHYRKAREDELRTLAFAIAHRILGAFPEDDLLIRTVRTALDEHRNTMGLRLRAGPAVAPLLRMSLSENDVGVSVTVEEDHTVPPGSCSLIHPRGRIAIGPLEQLLALLRASSLEVIP